MKPNNNKEFYEVAAKLVKQVNAKVQEVLDDYVEYLTNEEPDSFHSVMIPCFIESLRDEYIDVLSSLKELDEESYHRFLRGLDLE